MDGDDIAAAAARGRLILCGAMMVPPGPGLLLEMGAAASRMPADEDDQFGSFLLPDEVTLGHCHGIRAGGGSHRGESGAVLRRCFDWNGPRPWSGQAPAQAAAMRAAYEAGQRAGVDRGWMLSAVCGAVNDTR